MDPVKHSTPACPLCGSGSGSRLFRLKAGRAARLLIPDDREQQEAIAGEIGRLWEQDHCSFYRCRDCGYSYAWPFIAGDQKVYSLLYYKDFAYPADKWEYRHALQILGKSPPGPDAALLELGAGNGSFLDQVSSSLPELGSIHSTEYSEDGVKQIRDKGYSCHMLSLEELTSAELPPFKVICMFQVLEHLDKLDRVFKSLNQLTANGAALIISVPNGKLRSFYDRMGVKLDVPPVHVGRFTPAAFRKLAGIHGWEFKEARTEPQAFAFKLKKFIFNRYHSLALTHKSEASRNPFLKFGMRYAILLWLLFRYLPVAFYLLHPGSGTSLLVHLEKRGDRQ